MARFSVEGLDEVALLMLNEDKTATEAIPEMLKAGCEVLGKAQKSEMVRQGLVDTGDMINSIGPTRTRKTKTSSYRDVYPQGVDRKGTRNALKAFIAEYGEKEGKRGHFQPARPWLTASFEKSKDGVNDAMLEVWEKKHNAE